MCDKVNSCVNFGYQCFHCRSISDIYNQYPCYKMGYVADFVDTEVWYCDVFQCPRCGAYMMGRVDSRSGLYVYDDISPKFCIACGVQFFQRDK